MTTTKRNARTNRNIAIAIVAIVAIIATMFALVAIRYGFHSIMCNWAESEGSAMRYTATGLRNWSDADIAWYNEEIAAKQAFIESNAIAGFYNLFSGNAFFKLIRMALMVGSFFVAGTAWYLLYCVVDASIKRYHKRAARMAMRKANNHQVIDFTEYNCRKQAQRRSYTQAGYYPERKAR